MRMPGRRSRTPQRTPHPNPVTEVMLQGIISMQRTAARNEDVLDEMTSSVTRLTRMVAKHPTWDGHQARLNEIERLKGEIAQLTAQTRALHDEAAELAAKLDENDAAYLGG
jgi:hypothetical protein